jgi:NADPH:quinone reductase-like Zn-dependent oxidoreductase
VTDVQDAGTHSETTIPARMRAIVQDRYGNPDVMELAEVDTPLPGADAVLVRIVASSLNMFDVHMTTGLPLLARLSAGLIKPKHRIPGSDLAGIVTQVGANVTDFSVGDAVFGAIGCGAFAEYAAVPSRALAHKPDSVSFDKAASSPLAGTTALQALRDVGGLQPGQRVVVNGASGGVGTFAVQIAKALGAQVAAVCSTTKVDVVRALGADHVIDYMRQDYTEELEGYDLLLDNAGDRPWSETKRVLSRAGVQVTITGPKHRVMGPFRLLVFRKLMSGLDSRRFSWFTAQMKRDDIETLGGFLATETVAPMIERTYTLARIPDGLRYLSEGHAVGKLVVTG